MNACRCAPSLPARADDEACRCRCPIVHTWRVCSSVSRKLEKVRYLELVRRTAALYRSSPQAAPGPELLASIRVVSSSNLLVRVSTVPLASVNTTADHGIVQFKRLLEQRQVPPVCPSDHERHQRREPSGESARRAPVPKRHSRSAVFVLPCVCRLHGERGPRRPHRQTSARDELDNFVAMGQPASQEARDEIDSKTDVHGTRRLPLDRLDVLVPVPTEYSVRVVAVAVLGR